MNKIIDNPFVALISGQPLSKETQEDILTELLADVIRGRRILTGALFNQDGTIHLEASKRLPEKPKKRNLVLRILGWV